MARLRACLSTSWARLRGRHGIAKAFKLAFQLGPRGGNLIFVGRVRRWGREEGVAGVGQEATPRLMDGSCLPGTLTLTFPDTRVVFL